MRVVVVRTPYSGTTEERTRDPLGRRSPCAGVGWRAPRRSVKGGEGYMFELPHGLRETQIHLFRKAAVTPAVSMTSSVKSDQRPVYPC